MWDTIRKIQYHAKANVLGAKAELEERLHDRLELPLRWSSIYLNK